MSIVTELPRNPSEVDLDQDILDQDITEVYWLPICESCNSQEAVRKLQDSALDDQIVAFTSYRELRQHRREFHGLGKYRGTPDEPVTDLQFEVRSETRDGYYSNYIEPDELMIERWLHNNKEYLDRPPEEQHDAFYLGVINAKKLRQVV